MAPGSLARRGRRRRSPPVICRVDGDPSCDEHGFSVCKKSGGPQIRKKIDSGVVCSHGMHWDEFGDAIFGLFRSLFCANLFTLIWTWPALRNQLPHIFTENEPWGNSLVLVGHRHVQMATFQSSCSTVQTARVRRFRDSRGPRCMG